MARGSGTEMCLDSLLLSQYLCNIVNQYNALIKAGWRPRTWIAKTNSIDAYCTSPCAVYVYSNCSDITGLKFHLLYLYEYIVIFPDTGSGAVCVCVHVRVLVCACAWKRCQLRPKQLDHNQDMNPGATCLGPLLTLKPLITPLGISSQHQRLSGGYL